MVASKKSEMDVDISQISSCSYHSMKECEKKCGKYSRCYTIAIANDMLTEHEEKEACK